MNVPFLDVAAATAELRTELDAAWKRVADAGWFIKGPELEAFEHEYAAYTGCAHAIGVGNGLDALALALRALGVGHGDDVLVPSHTFVATWLAVSSVGATPVPVEPDATMNLDPARAADARTTRTRAVIAVHLYGQCADMDALADALPGVAIVEDAAQAQGATWRGQRAGNLGTIAGVSLYPGKNLGALGDAGIVTTNDGALAAEVRRLGHYGQTQRYHHDVLGTNSRLDELQAAFLRVKLRALDGWNARRRRVAWRYAEALANGPVTLPVTRTEAESAWHLFIVQTPKRDDLAAHLARRGVATQIHYPVAVDACGAYAGHVAPQPEARRLAREVLSLPIGPHLTDSQVDAVIEGVLTWSP